MRWQGPLLQTAAVACWGAFLVEPMHVLDAKSSPPQGAAPVTLSCLLSAIIAVDLAIFWTWSFIDPKQGDPIRETLPDRVVAGSLGVCVVLFALWLPYISHTALNSSKSLIPIAVFFFGGILFSSLAWIEFAARRKARANRLAVAARSRPLPPELPFCPVCQEPMDEQPLSLAHDPCCRECSPILWYLRHRLGAKCRLPYAAVIPSARLEEDLELDAVESIAVLQTVQQEYRVSLWDEDLPQPLAISDLIRFLRRTAGWLPDDRGLSDVELAPRNYFSRPPIRRIAERAHVNL